MLRSHAGVSVLFRRSRRRKLPPDYEGVEFASTHDARVDASRALAEMVKGAMPNGPRTASALGLEGIVSKRVTSRYKSGSCLAWVKVKN